MHKNILYIVIITSLPLLFFSCGKSSASPDQKIGEGPKIPFHIDQANIEDYSIEELISHGELLFSLSFNELDGLGRPESTGSGRKRPRRESPQNFNRISGPDANSCVACHNLPRIGGGGDNSTNVFGLSSDVDFATLEGSIGSDNDSSSILDITNERNTVGIFGDGLVELLAREITYDLLKIVNDARKEAKENNLDIKKELTSKGINFGYITIYQNGYIDTSELDGIDNDFILRPFIQKGVVPSLRDFSNNAMNHHHGMQSEELAGNNSDPDRDGIINELTEGDITAITLFQATLDYPKRNISDNKKIRESQNNGEIIFDEIGCSSCHISKLPLESLKFTEPGPFNTENSTTLTESTNNLVIDLKKYVSKLEKDKDGNYLVPLYSDLKRHDMGHMLDNERPIQGGVPTNYWLTRKLWGFYSEPPFLHHGRSSLLTNVIEMHQGDAKISSDAFFELSETEKADLMEFLKSFK